MAKRGETREICGKGILLDHFNLFWCETTAFFQIVGITFAPRYEITTHDKCISIVKIVLRDLQ